VRSSRDNVGSPTAVSPDPT